MSYWRRTSAKRLRRIPSTSSEILLVFALSGVLVFTSPLLAQQSYGSYQRLSGRVLPNAAAPGKKPSTSAASPDAGVPTKFRGWKHPGRFPAKYSAHFSRPRARAARAELLQNVARKAAQQKSSASPQFSASQLAGILLRDSLPSGFIPTAIASGDFNGDGNLDFVVANGGDNTLWLYFGNGNGTFSLPTIVPVTMGQSPVWISTGDLRGIERTDLLVAEADSNSVGVFLSNGDGTFVESVVALPSTAVCLLVADFNNDGKLDIAAPMNDENSETDPNVYIATLPGLGNGSFGAPVITPLDGYVPFIVYGSVADLNGDGNQDLLLISDGSIQEIAAQVFLGNGDGTFTPGTVVGQDSPASLLTASALFDADGEGNLDAVLTDASGTLWVYHGNGDGTFSANPSGMFEMGSSAFDIAVADVNGDGIPDVVVSDAIVDDSGLYGTDAGDQISVLLGDGKGNFSAPTVYRGDSSSYSLVVGQFNNGGLPDAVTANQDSDSVTVFLNNGSGGFGAPSGSWVGYQGVGVAKNVPASGVLAADIDGNGTTDIAFLELPPESSTYYQLTVLLNDGTGNLSAPIRSDAADAYFTDWVLADFRNTGSPDSLSISTNYITNASYYFFVPNSGGGHFGPLTQTNLPNAYGVIGVGDFNGDGKLDFVAAGYGINNQPLNGIAVFLGNGDGTFRTGYVQNFGVANEPSPVAVYVGDFNRDGNLDLLVLLEGNGGFLDDANVYEFLGNGDGTFKTGTVAVPNIGPMVVADVNGDGYPDIVGMLDPRAPFGMLNPVLFSIYIGQPDGTFTLTNTYQPYSGGSALPQQLFAPPYGKYAPMVADFNGDGILDIAAFQQIGTQNIDTYVQLLLGNGDGTFTPSYDIFDFRQPSVTTYAVDLLGTGHAGLFEMNGYLSTYDWLPPIVGPPFQVSLLQDPIPGTQGSGLLLLDVPSTSATTISLTASDPAIQVPATLTVPAGSVSQTFSVDIGPTFNTNHVFAITAQLGSSSAVAYGTAVASGAVGFQAGAGGPSPWPNVNLGAGQSVNNLGIYASSLNGYTATIRAQCTGLSPVAQCQISPSTFVIRPGDRSNATFSISVAANAPQGSYPGNVQVSDGLTTQNFPFTVNVGDFSMSLNPQVLQVFPTSQNESYNLTVGAINQFDQIVNLACGGLPTGASCYIEYPTITVGDGLPGTVAVQTQSVAPGNYQITVTGTSAPLTHTATAELQVWDFNPSVSPSSATVNAGGSANFNVTVAPVNGFTGTVTFACTSTSALVSCSFNPTSATVSGNASVGSTLTITAKSAAARSKGASLSAEDTLGVLLISLSLPVGALFMRPRRRQEWSAIIFLTLALFATLSCGGGSGTGGGGGGGGSQSYSITVQVNSSNSYTKTAGPVTLTVN